MKRARRKWRRTCARPPVSATSASWACCLLQGIVDRSLIDDFVAETLGPLIAPGRKHPHVLVHTLDALLKENGNGLKAAQRLGLHRNTINQRIQRIEQLSGQSLDDPLFRTLRSPCWYGA